MSAFGTASAQTSASLGGMILLEPANRILRDTIKDKIESFQEEKKAHLSLIKLCDFDDVQYVVKIDPSVGNKMEVLTSMPCYKQIESQSKPSLEKIYGNLLMSEAPAGYEIGVSIDLENPSDTSAAIAEKVAMLKTNTIGAVFDHYFTAMLSGGSSEPFQFALRADTKIYIFPSTDRVAVIFSLDFNEPSDRVLARVFLQEFTDCRRHLGAAPPCSFNHNPPLEMKHFGITEPISKDHLGFVSFAILKSHLEGPKKERVINNLQSFRNYMQYHIKCSKAYFHSRMRARVVSLIKFLNRAKQETDEEVVKKKMSGKTFNRS